MKAFMKFSSFTSVLLRSLKGQLAILCLYIMQNRNDRIKDHTKCMQVMQYVYDRVKDKSFIKHPEPDRVKLHKTPHFNRFQFLNISKHYFVICCFLKRIHGN